MEDLTKTQLVLLLLLVSIVVSFATAIVTAALLEQAPAGTVGQVIQRVVERVVPPNAGSEQAVRIVSDEERLIEVVGHVSPAVVSVIASKDLPKLEECFGSPFGDEDLFGRIFPDLRVPQLCERGTERRQVSAGSGFFVGADGLIVTNRHVVQDHNAQYTVIMNTGKHLDARVLARDPIQDIAVLKVEGTDFPFITLGDSSKLRIGQTVIAIGNALGEFDNTVSRGVISGLRRTVVASGEELRALIQTDAAINPGNSGGPLVTLDGSAVGINTAIAAGAENIGFALPINLVKKDLQDVRDNGKITYPFLGVRYRMIDKELAAKNHLPVEEGALLVSGPEGPAVMVDSPAGRTNLREGDIIVEFDSKAVTQKSTLAELIVERRVGQTITLKVRRGAEELIFSVRLEEFRS